MRGRHGGRGCGRRPTRREDGAEIAIADRHRSEADKPIHLSTFSTEVVKRGVRQTDLPSTFRFHHLRHTGLSILAEHGASMAELQARAGHTTAAIAMRYQHARAERDCALAGRLGEVAQATGPRGNLANDGS